MVVFTTKTKHALRGYFTWFRWLSGGGGETRVEASVYGDRVDRPTRSLFGLAGKIPPEKFSGGGATVAGGGEESPEKMREGDGRELCV
ncbi:hypothetical protein Tco_0021165, partial [Tanacetum coccineum]